MPSRVAARGRAQRRLGGALLLGARAAARAGEGRLARYTWRDAYAELREQLDALGDGSAARYRVLVDANQHVDREAAARSGVGFYGKNTMLITRRHGSWVVLGTLVTDVELEPTPPLDDRLRRRAASASTPARPVRSTSPGRSTRRSASRTGRRRRRRSPRPYRAALGAQVYGCDICQDVCPWNRGVEKRRARPPTSDGRRTSTSSRWLEQDGGALVDEYDRLYVPRNDPRWLRRNALVALGNTGGRRASSSVLERHAAGDDELLAEHAAWALGRVGTDVSRRLRLRA